MTHKYLSLALITVNFLFFSCGKKTANMESISEVKIGNQIWSTQNLNVTTFANGDQIQEAKSRDEWNFANKNERPAWCYLNNDSSTHYKIGRIYNLFAILDSRGLAPKGWHIPNTKEWWEMVKELGEWRRDDYVGYNVAKKMKSAESWSKNAADNSSGFEALPAGYRKSTGEFNLHGASWWSSSNVNYGDKKEMNDAWLIYLLVDVSDNIELRRAGQHEGHFVRCVKN